MSWRRRWGEESGSNIYILRFAELNEVSCDVGLVYRCLCCSDLPHMNIVLCPLRMVMWGCCACGAHSFLVFPVLEPWSLPLPRIRISPVVLTTD